MKLRKLDKVFLITTAVSLVLGVVGVVNGEKVSPLSSVISSLTMVILFARVVIAENK